jgi:hypothetical protein
MIDQALLCLATTIFMESSTEPHQAQIAVGYVLYRRADFDTKQICYEMKRPYQFSWYGYKKPPSDINKYYFNLAWRIMHKLEPDYSYGATHFHDTSIKNPWKMKPIIKWSHLIFYKQEESKYAVNTNPIRVGVGRI